MNQLENGSTDPKTDSAELPNNEPIEQIETQKKQTGTNKQKSMPVQFSFKDEAANEDDMGAVRDILSSSRVESDEIEMGMESFDLLTAEEVYMFLKGTYDVQGYFTYPDLWKRDDSFFHEIAVGILPQINNWASRVPAVAHSIKAVSAAGSWGRLIWDIAWTWFMVTKTRQEEERKKLEEEEMNKNAGYTNQSPNRSGGVVIP